MLYNLFLANPSQPNFIAFSLQRTTGRGDDVQGNFSIGMHCTSVSQARYKLCLGEFEPAFANVSNNAPISTWPVTSPRRWNVLIDAVIANNTITVPTTSVVGAPTNKAVALIDSGASYSSVFSVDF